MNIENMYVYRNIKTKLFRNLEIFEFKLKAEIS